MNHPRTIAALNEHWWYRLLKVVYISLETLAILFGVLLAFLIFYNQGVNYTQTTISCDNGLSTTLDKVSTSTDLWEVDYANLYYPSYGPSDLELKIYNACAHYVRMSDGMAHLTVTENHIDYSQVTEIDGRPYNGDGGFIPFYFDHPYKNYSIAIVKNKQLPQTIGFSLLIVIGVALMFEIIRHIFYYIVLGRFFAPKN